MSKTKKLLSMLLVVALVAGIAISGTLAYLTSEDGDVNVMTLGNVQIEQNEDQRVDTSKAGTLTEEDIEQFEQGKPLLPYVDENLNGAMRDDYEEVTFPNGQTNKFFIGDNAIDKMVSVTNTGKTDAYVRTIIALEAPTDKIDLSFNSTDWTMDETASSYSIEVDGVKYDLFVCVYKEILKPGETTPYSLLQIILDGTATNDDAAAYGDTYDVLVLSQAVQTAGFPDAATALNTGFGEVNAENAAEWFGADEFEIPVIVNSVEEMAAICKTGGTMILGSDIIYTAENTEEMKDGSIFLINGKNVTVDLNGHNFTVAEDATQIFGAIFFIGNPNGHINIIGDGKIEVKNKLATVVWVLQTGTANIYGGTYISNSVSNEAILYSQGNGGVINVYGGKFVYDLDRHLNGGFNVSDQAGANLRIIIHEGVMLSRPEYSQHLQGTNNGEEKRIQLAEGCTLQEVVIDGTTWYQVVKTN